MKELYPLKPDVPRYTVTIYSNSGTETYTDAQIMIVDGANRLNWLVGLWIRRRSSTYVYASRLTSVQIADGDYIWYRGSQDLTDAVYDWLDINEYTWPLDREQFAHFTLTWL